MSYYGTCNIHEIDQKLAQKEESTSEFTATSESSRSSYTYSSYSSSQDDNNKPINQNQVKKSEENIMIAQFLEILKQQPTQVGQKKSASYHRGQSEKKSPPERVPVPVQVDLHRPSLIEKQVIQSYSTALLLKQNILLRSESSKNNLKQFLLTHLDNLTKSRKTICNLTHLQSHSSLLESFVSNIDQGIVKRTGVALSGFSPLNVNQDILQRVLQSEKQLGKILYQQGESLDRILFNEGEREVVGAKMEKEIRNWKAKLEKRGKKEEKEEE